MPDVEPRWKQPREEKHPRGCVCKPCIGRRSRRKGLRKQNEARKALGVPKTRNASQSSNEENWRHVFRWEVKSGRMAGPSATQFLAAEKQAEQNKVLGDTRPCGVVFMPDGWGSEGLVVVRLSTWRTHLAPLLER